MVDGDGFGAGRLLWPSGKGRMQKVGQNCWVGDGVIMC